MQRETGTASSCDSTSCTYFLLLAAAVFCGTAAVQQQHHRLQQLALQEHSRHAQCMYVIGWEVTCAYKPATGNASSTTSAHHKSMLYKQDNRLQGFS